MNTLVIGDVHGNPNALRDILIRSGAVDPEDGHPNDDWTVISVGDLANMAPLGDSFRGFVSNDKETLELAERYVDIITVGNHEVYYTHGALNVGEWYGMAQSADPERLALLNSMTRSGKYRAAASAHGWLITHAGVHPAFQSSLIFDMDNAAEMAAQYLCGYLEGRATRELPPTNLIDGADGIFWLRPSDVDDWMLRFNIEYNDLNEVLDHEPLKQIVGHTPESFNPRYDVGYKTWYIDNGGYFRNNRGSGIIWNNELETWEVVQ